MNVERIKFERTGGFAGIRFAADVELKTLPEEQARTLLDLLDDLDFAKLPPQIAGNPAMSDQFTYTVTVVAETWKHTVIVRDVSAPEKMQELLQLLTQIAKKQAGSNRQ